MNDTGKGIDQLLELIHQIKTRFQKIDFKSLKEMSCVNFMFLMKRSCLVKEVLTCVPFNTASWLAKCCDLKCGDFTHVYLNHEEWEEFKNIPTAFPKLNINPDKLKLEHFELSNNENGNLVKFKKDVFVSLHVKKTYSRNKRIIWKEMN